MKVRLHTNAEGKATALIIYCPGCQSGHVFSNLTEERGWKWDGNAEAPTCQPSLLINPKGEYHVPGVPLCHLVLTAGVIYFCPDSEHPFAGKSIPLVDFPPDYYS